VPAVVRRAAVGGTRHGFSAWLDGTYDLVWHVRIESWLAVGDLVDGPAIVDYDDLRDRLLRSRRSSTWPDPVRGPRRGSVGEGMRALSDRAEARAWGRLQRRVAPRVDAVVVCSELDRDRLGLPNAAVVPNGVALPDRAAGRAGVGTPPVVSLHGSLRYRPNADAARLLVRDVLPRLRAERPDVLVRLVGDRDEQLADLADPPRVALTGRVPDITAELARADVVAVPLREGSGTRIKILEALAHRIPVVATSIAVDGLDVVHDRHLLVADDPERFASSCARLLVDLDLRRRLADEGERLVRAGHGREQARAAVAALATRVAGRRPGTEPR